MAVLTPHRGTVQLPTRAGDFQLKWAMLRLGDKGICLHANARRLTARMQALTKLACSSLVIRDLTLRSANSFGMFHLMRLLCDGTQRLITITKTEGCCQHQPNNLTICAAEYVFFLLENTIMTGAVQIIQHLPDGGNELKVRAMPVDFALECTLNGLLRPCSCAKSRLNPLPHTLPARPGPTLRERSRRSLSNAVETGVVRVL